MRRRSERKKSSSPAPVPARRSRRSRKVSENEKTEDEALVQKEIDTPEPPPPPPTSASREEINEPRASSEEPVGSPVRKSRASRATPKKRAEAKNAEKKVETIPEEEAENGQDVGSNNVGKAKEKEADGKDSEPEAEAINVLPTEEAANNNEKEAPEEEAKPEAIAAEDKEDDKEDEGQPQMDAGVEDDKNCQGEQIEEVKVPSPSGSLTASKDEEQLKTSGDVLDIQIEDVEERDDEAPAASCPAGSQRSERRDSKKKHKDQKTDRERSPAKEQDQEEGEAEEEEEQKENRKQAAEEKSEHTEQNEDADLQKDKHQDSSAINNINSNTTTSTAAGAVQRSVKKRRWLTNKKSSDRAPPVLAISTDSLKNIIDDVVQPVPLSDVQLDSSSEEEGLVTSDRESDRSTSLTRANSEIRKDRECDNDNNVAETGAAESSSSAPDKETAGATTVRTSPPPATAADSVKAQAKATVATAAPHVVRSPSPARNRASHVLYITNLVRPFTVLQLKGLLARTGKIVDEDGFWIDRIKSKCFVAYSTEDEAIETRHALHGVRWPVSNPKCLNVDFGSRTDMDRAIQSTKDETPRYGQENTRDNQQAGNTWSRLDATDKKPVRPVREWDVGKKEPADHDNKSINDRRRGGSKDRLEPKSREAERAGQERKRSREREVRGGRERERVVGGDRNVHGRSRSGSPVAKNKKKDNEPPIRLLDDLFRKTKGTPCIYWLPLTPEAIAEKEAFRQKRIEEYKQRIKEREDRQKEREKDRERQRDTRRNRSNERRRSRSRDRDRRRY
ncbi:hypothetical protein KR032_010198 [Drosophila birchii]|nr:hypothetical protein KR032_010198 [Drosophila birchii]